ncbi:hypothetical protein LTR85_011714 [Meristemomyces frigidus]|nr:hypothetical protein LTR85_011714 [Meristemomyces frigidus]
MRLQPASPSPSWQRTIFLVADIHCVSCTAFIEELLFRLRPRPTAVQTSIVTHSVTVEHDTSLGVSTIAGALAEAGYVIDNIIPHASQDSTSPDDLRSAGDVELALEDLNQTVYPARRMPAAEEDARRRRHIEHCEQCRAKSPDVMFQETERRPSSFGSTNKEIVASSFVVVEPHPATHRVFHASIAISGMSCSSCVSKITEALEQKPWVRSANVALLSQTASVEFEGEEHAKELVPIINDVGYDASLEQVRGLQPPLAVGSLDVAGFWKASFSIEGMTCSSCVGTVTDALSDLACTQSVDVNLITNSAMVVYEDKDNLDQILLAIEDAGYGVTLNGVVPFDKEKDKNGRRAVSLRIDGMYCEHCSDRVMEALDHLDQPVVVEQSPTIVKPILTISYTPNAPAFTIRDILTAISAADTAFTPAVYHPPSITERARRMHARIRQQVLYRVVLAVMVAIPTFIIGIVFMSLVPGSTPGRRYLTQKVHGVTRAEWALLVLATPVYFFGADIFHRRTIRELHSLWGRRSPVPVLRRFYRFGSMDMLLSFGTTIAYVSSNVGLVIKSISAGSVNTTGNSTYFDSVVFLTMFLLMGRLIEAYSKAKTGEAVTMLSKLRPQETLLVLPKDGSKDTSCTMSVNIDLVDSGDVVRVVHGGSPP